jgi:hypothetical protein
MPADSSFSADSSSLKSAGTRDGLILLALVLLAGIAYSFLLPPVARFPDEREYLQLSNSLAHGHGYSMDGIHLTAMRPPGYPFFISAIRAIGGGIIAIRIVHYLLLAGTILLVSRVCSETRPLSHVLAVTLLVMAYPVLFYTSGTLYPQTLAGFLFMLAIAQLVATKKSLLLAATTGLTFGFLILVVPTFLFTLAVVLVVGFALKIVPWRNALLIFVAASFLIGLWTTRNAVRFHQFVPIASNSGENFLIGNNEKTIPWGGAGNIDIGHYRLHAWALDMDEFRMDHYYRDSALEWIEEHPGQATVLYFRKALNFFSGWNYYASYNLAEISPAKQNVVGISYYILLALLLWRLIEYRRFPLTATEKLLILVYVLSAFTQAIFFTRIRLRLPYDYLIIAVIAMHLTNRLNAWLRARRSG